MANVSDQPQNLAEFADRGPLAVLAFVILATMLITVPIGLIARAIVEGLTHGWRWPDRSKADREKGSR